MPTIQLKSDYPHDHISVPRVFIDTYMTDAHGEFVKVYLYLLRCMSSSDAACSISAIADHFNNTEKDILRALKYWEKAGVIGLELNTENRLTGLVFHDLTECSASKTPETNPVSTNDNTAPAKTKKTKTADGNTDSQAAVPKTSSLPEKKEYTLDEIQAFHDNHEVSELLFIVETYLKHPLSSPEMNTLFFWYDRLGFPCELIEYLVEYCISNGHSSLRYMDKVALSWAENHITTIEKAKEQVSVHSKTYYAIMKAFGISGRALADSENAFVNKWTQEYSFDIELIQEACKRTISATQKPSFEYADSILTNWHKNRVHSLKDVTVLDNAYNRTKHAAKPPQTPNSTIKRNKFNNFQQRTYDSNELEKVLLTTSVE